MELKSFRNIFAKVTFDLVVYGIGHLVYVCGGVLLVYISPQIDYFDSVPGTFKSAFVGMVFVIIYAGYRLYKNTSAKNILINNSGLFYFRPNTAETDRKENRKLLLEKIQTSKSVEIIGATGYNTFAKPEQPEEKAAILRDALGRDITGEIKILLLHPDGPFTKMRATSIGAPIDTYREEIFNSIAYLKELCDKGKTVSLKLYKQKPIWKMIVLDDFLWLQFYDPKGHVEKLPVYGFYKKGNCESLFEPLYAVFQKKWHFDHNPTYDFDKNQLVYPEDKDGNIKREDLKSKS